MERYSIKFASLFKMVLRWLPCLSFCLIHKTSQAQEQAEQIFKRLNQQFSSNTTKDQQFGELFLLVFAGAVMIFVIWVAYHFVTQRKESASSGTPWGIYKKLCRVHKLSFLERYVIRKIGKQNGFDDPLPLFVEPKYFYHVLEDQNMGGYRNVIHEILRKLFGHQQELVPVAQMAMESNMEAVQMPLAETTISSATEELPKESHEEKIAPNGNIAAIADVQEAHDTETAFQIHEKQAYDRPGMSKVTLSTIPGNAAFSSLVEPLNQISTEIAASSIRHNLADSRELNQRTYDGIGERPVGPSEPQTPLFPKPYVPTPEEMLAPRTQKSNLKENNSPTPRYLQARSPRQNVNGFPVSQNAVKMAKTSNDVQTPKPGEVLTLDDVALLETIVMGK